MLYIEKDFTAKRTFEDIRNLILLSLASGQKTINQIAGETKVNWRTVSNHLVHLSGKTLVKEAFSSSYVRIYELTAFGKDHLRKNGIAENKISDNKIINLEVPKW
ncbi:MAG: ArsR family transcriptional regulator [Nanoarchaeota archaeon]